MKLLLLLIAALAGFAAWVRLAPSDPAIWHTTPTIAHDADMAGGAVRVLTAPREDFEALDQIIRATPRTTVLAGSTAESKVTYITRSALWGFPDYTTMDFAQGQLRIFGRLRFGYADLGVNAARIDAWIADLRKR